VKLESDLVYDEQPVPVLEVQEQVTRSRVVQFFTVVWGNHTEQEATWEREDYLKTNHPFYAKW
jgi:hypothetical protein